MSRNKMLHSAIIKKITQDLQQDPRSVKEAHKLVVENIKYAPSRYIYRYLYPFWVYNHQDELNQLIQFNIVDEAMKNNYEQIRRNTELQKYLLFFGYSFFQGKKQFQEAKKGDFNRVSPMQIFMKEFLAKEASGPIFKEKSDFRILNFYLFGLALHTVKHPKYLLPAIEAIMLYNEEDLKNLTNSEIITLIKSLWYIITYQYNLLTEDNQKHFNHLMQACIELRKNEDQDPSKFVQISSKENIFLREILKKILGESNFIEEHKIFHIYSADFYIPKAKLVIEINGRNHFYPYTNRFSQNTNLKNKYILENGYNIMNLNSFTLEGLMLEPNKVEDLLLKTIRTYELKTNQETPSN